MKLLLAVVLVMCAVITVQGTPVSKKQQQQQPKCATFCTADYTPVCGGDPNDKSVKPRLFSNECVMSVHNCENKSNLVKIDFSKCKGVGGIRLS